MCYTQKSRRPSTRCRPPAQMERRPLQSPLAQCRLLVAMAEAMAEATMTVLAPDANAALQTDVKLSSGRFFTMKFVYSSATGIVAIVASEVLSCQSVKGRL